MKVLDMKRIYCLCPDSKTQTSSPQPGNYGYDVLAPKLQMSFMLLSGFKVLIVFNDVV
jgi:hypothetical protein